MKKQQNTKILHFQNRTPILDQGFDRFYPEGPNAPFLDKECEFKYEGVLEFKQPAVC
jgi:hypothetical protein